MLDVYPTMLNPWNTKCLEIYHSPFHFRYEAWLDNKEDAHSCVYTSLYAFKALFALVTYGLLLMERRNETWLRDYNEPAPPWRDVLNDKYGVPYQLLDDILASMMGDFTAPRLGGFVDMGEPCQWPSMLPHFKKANMYLILHWSLGTV
jgi:hypothetical protein